MLPILSLIQLTVGLVEKAVEIMPKIKEALASNELTPETRAELEARIKAAQSKLTEWK